MEKILRAPLTALFLALLCAALLACNLTQMLSLALLPVSPAAFRAVNRLVAGSWFTMLVWGLRHVAGVELVRSGDPLPKGENAFVIANHQSGADIPVLLVEAVASGRAGDIKWFVKDPIKWVPGIGWGMLFLDCIYVKRNWTADKERILATFDRLRRNRTRFWLVSFLEGTRLKPAKLQRSQDFCRKAGLPVLAHVMSPRTRGFESTLEGLGDSLDAVYDCTIAYEGFPPAEAGGVRSLFFGGMRRIHLHVKRTPLSALPASREARASWVLEAFSAKDALLARFYREGFLR